MKLAHEIPVFLTSYDVDYIMHRLNYFGKKGDKRSKYIIKKLEEQTPCVNNW